MIYLSNYSLNLNPHAYALEPTYNTYAKGAHAKGKMPFCRFLGKKPLSKLNTKRLNFLPKQSQHNSLFFSFSFGDAGAFDTFDKSRVLKFSSEEINISLIYTILREIQKKKQKIIDEKMYEEMDDLFKRIEEENKEEMEEMNKKRIDEIIKNKINEITNERIEEVMDEHIEQQIEEDIEREREEQREKEIEKQKEEQGEGIAEKKKRIDEQNRKKIDERKKKVKEDIKRNNERTERIFEIIDELDDLKKILTLTFDFSPLLSVKRKGKTKVPSPKVPSPSTKVPSPKVPSPSTKVPSPSTKVPSPSPSKQQEQSQDLLVKSKALLCWHADIGFLNLRHWFLNLLRAMHLLWTTAKNNGRVMLVSNKGPFDAQAHLSAVNHLMQCQLSPTLRRQANKPVSLHITFSKFGPNVGFIQLTQLTHQMVGVGVGSESKIHASNHVSNHRQLLFLLGKKVRLWIKFHQLGSRLITCTYGTVKMGWFSNRFVSNYVWNPLMVYDERMRRGASFSYFSYFSLKEKKGKLDMKRSAQLLSKYTWSNEQNRMALGTSIKVVRTQSHGLTKWKDYKRLNTYDTASLTQWFQLPEIHRSKTYLSRCVANPNSRNSANSPFVFDLTKTMTAKSYIQRFYNTAEPKQPHQRSSNIVPFNLSKQGPIYNALSTGRQSACNHQLAKNMLLGQINAVVFSHPESSAKLVQQARNLNIPTIGLCGGFAQENLKAKANKSLFSNREGVDFPIIANPNNHNNVTMLFYKMTKASLKYIKA